MTSVPPPPPSSAAPPPPIIVSPLSSSSNGITSSLSPAEKAKRWLKRKSLGADLPKNTATHHAEVTSGLHKDYEYYQIASRDNVTLMEHIISSYESGVPLTLNEHAPKLSRLFIDIDSNKDPECRPVTDGDVSSMITDMRESLEYLVTKGKLHISVRPQVSSLYNDSIWAWAHSSYQVDDDELTRPLGPSPGIFQDEDPEFDPYMAVVLASPLYCSSPPGSESEPLATYHVVWPFLVGELSSFFYETFFAPHVLSRISSDNPCLQPKHIDANVWINRAMRGYLCDKMTETGRLAGRPFVYRLHVTNKPLRTGWTESKMDIWLATSLLYSPPQQTEPTRSASSMSLTRSTSASNTRTQDWGTWDEPIQPPPRSRPRSGGPETTSIQDYRDSFYMSKEVFSPERLEALMKEAYRDCPDRTSEECIKLTISEAVTKYLNTFFAFIYGKTNNFIAFRSWRKDDKYPDLVYKKPTDWAQFLAAGGVQSFLVVPPPGKKKFSKVTLRASQIWLESSARLCFESIVVKPPCFSHQLRKEDLNIWTPHYLSKEEAEGFAKSYKFIGTDGKEHSVADFQEHIRTHIAAGDNNLYNYIVNAIAFIIQNPGKKLGTCLVLKGPEGCGKNYLINVLLAIIGRHSSMITASQKDLTSSFNTSLEGKALFVFNEASKIDNEAVGALKSMITDSTMRIERKNVDSYQVDQILNVMILTNTVDIPVVMVTNQSRRFVICDCISPENNTLPTGERSDTEYWKNLWKFIGKGAEDDIYKITPGIKAVADWFYNHKIPADWNTREIPITKGLVDMKFRYFTAASAWWYESLRTMKFACFDKVRQTSEFESLMTGTRLNALSVAEELFSTWSTQEILVPENLLWQCFLAWISQSHNRSYEKSNVGSSTLSVFWTHLRKVLEIKHYQPRIDEKPTNLRMLLIPALSKCRQRFAKEVPGITFEDEEIDTN
jgi:hypothetical protein